MTIQEEERLRDQHYKDLKCKGDSVSRSVLSHLICEVTSSIRVKYKELQRLAKSSRVKDTQAGLDKMENILTLVLSSSQFALSDVCCAAEGVGNLQIGRLRAHYCAEGIEEKIINDQIALDYINLGEDYVHGARSKDNRDGASVHNSERGLVLPYVERNNDEGGLEKTDMNIFSPAKRRVIEDSFDHAEQEGGEDEERMKGKRGKVEFSNGDNDSEESDIYNEDDQNDSQLFGKGDITFRSVMSIHDVAETKLIQRCGTGALGRSATSTNNATSSSGNGDASDGSSNDAMSDSRVVETWGCVDFNRKWIELEVNYTNNNYMIILFEAFFAFLIPLIILFPFNYSLLLSTLPTLFMSL